MTTENEEWDDATKFKHLANIYYAAGDPGSLGGAERLLKRAHEIGLPVTREDVTKFLASQLTYTVHRQVRRKFQRNKTVVGRVDQQWQADLADMQKLADDNGGNKYILTCVDVLSRHAWVVPVRSKHAEHMLAAMRALLRKAQPRKPERLQTDKGLEFFNRQVSAFLREHEIHHFASNSDTKAALVERFNRTLKGRLWRYFTANDTRRYVNVLDDVVDSYNRSVHRAIGMAPADVTRQSEAKVWQRLYYDGKHQDTGRNDAIPDDTAVRIPKWKGDFDKGYVGNWTREHFLVDKNVEHPTRTFELRDMQGEPVRGAFYRDELQPIGSNTMQVERVIRNRGNESLVKWRGWSDQFNSWIPKKQLIEYQSKTPAERDSVYKAPRHRK